MAPPRFHDLRIAARRQETADAVVLTFAVPPELQEAYRFRPGQYLTLRATINGQDIRRSYSICSCPDGQGLPENAMMSVGIKHVDGGLFSAWATAVPNPGAMMSVMTPDGRFGLPPATGRRNVAAFAAGSGITPVLSILKWTLEHEPGTNFFLFYGNRSTAGIMFRDAIEDLKDRFLSRLSVFHVLSREQQDIPVLNGRLDAGKARLLLRSVLPIEAVDQALVCGPQPMIEGLAAILGKLGLSAERTHVERFTPSADGRPYSPQISESAAPSAIVTVISEGIRSDIPMAKGEAIIDAALRAGRMLPYSCKGGMCCTCRAKVMEGHVEMAVNYSLEPWELAAGFVLTCQARLVTSRAVVDYDQV